MGTEKKVQQLRGVCRLRYERGGRGRSLAVACESTSEGNVYDRALTLVLDESAI